MSDMHEVTEKLRTAYEDWRNADTTAQLHADPEDYDAQALAEAAEEAAWAWDQAASLFMLNADAILAALSHEWRPIETAPKGDRVLLKSGLNDRILIGFNVGDGWIESGSRHMSYPPTHWMPLPTPPQGEDG